MNKPLCQHPAPEDRQDDPEVAAAKETLLLLNEQADELRAHLATLRQSLREIRRDFSESQAAQLREANEELVLAALHANTIAE